MSINKFREKNYQKVLVELENNLISIPTQKDFISNITQHINNAFKKNVLSLSLLEELHDYNKAPFEIRSAQFIERKVDLATENDVLTYLELNCTTYPVVTAFRENFTISFVINGNMVKTDSKPIYFNASPDYEASEEYFYNADSPSAVLLKSTHADYNSAIFETLKTELLWLYIRNVYFSLFEGYIINEAINFREITNPSFEVNVYGTTDRGISYDAILNGAIVYRIHKAQHTFHFDLFWRELDLTKKNRTSQLTANTNI